MPCGLEIMDKKKLFLIDAMALIYRSFYAMNKSPRVNTKGMNTSAAFGFVNTLLSLIKQYGPEYIGMAFDLHAPTFRHKQFAEYKANRQATPEEIRSMEPYIRQLIEAMHIPILSSEGYEADDVIGTLSKKAAKQGFDVFMVTPDKDYAQLVEENIRILKLGKFGAKDEVWGVEEVKAKFEVREPKQVIDILGLWGDTSDNIPGVPSIGEKKAKALLQQFDSIEDIVEHSDRITAASVRKAIEENKEQALLSKFLATIVLDVPVEFSPEELRFSQPDLVACRRIFEELEFKGLAKSFFDYFSQSGMPHSEVGLFASTPASELQTDLFAEQYGGLDSLKSDNSYLLLESEEEQADFLKSLQAKAVVAFNLVSSGDELLGIAFSTEAKQAAFLPLGDVKQPSLQVIELLKTFFSSPDIVKTAYDLKEEMHLLARLGIRVEQNTFDVLIAHYLGDSEASHALDLLAETFLSYRMVDAPSALAKTKSSQKTILQTIDKDKLRDYACERADIILQLQPVFERKLEETEMKHLFYDMEMPLLYVLFDMERAGVRLDVEELAHFSSKLSQSKQEVEKQIYELAGEEFNILSPKQLGEVLFTKLQIAGEAKTKRTATKQFSTAEEVLQKFVSVHPIVPLVLQYRTLTKLKNTYVDALPELIDPKDKRLHTSFNQAVTATGRLSSNNPNLQNIPIRTTLGKEIRRCFVARDENHTLLAADYSQIELRIIASLSGDEHLCQAFQRGEDIHRATAAKIYHIAPEEVTKDQRARVKSVNFGIIYGISAFGLSQGLSISRKEAQELINQYFASYPQVASYIESCKQTARERGYAQSLCGRRRYLKDIRSANANLRAFAERNAVNMPVQASSADMIKLAMVRISRRMKEERLQSKMILQVHDELVFDVLNSELETLKAIVVKEMTEALKLNVPVEVDARSGANWLEAH